ncbi:MAG: pilin [Candidatus Paceibacteria bacterium]
MRRYLFWGAGALFLTLPLTALAYTIGDQLVPQELVEKAPYLQGCDIIHLANNLIGFAVYLSVMVASVMFAYAGFLYVTAAARSDNLNQAKGIFGKVFLGLVIVLAAWLIVDIILSVFTEKDFGFWSDIKCEEFTFVTPTDLGAIETVPIDERLETENRALLSIVDIGVNHPNACEPGQTKECITTAGLSTRTIGYIMETKKACDATVGASCDITVTGGSEEGHAGGTNPGSHGAGDKVDLRITPNVRTYIETQVDSGAFSVVEDPIFGSAQWVDVETGAVWTDEGDHYDICVENCDAPAARGS